MTPPRKDVDARESNGPVARGHLSLSLEGLRRAQWTVVGGMVGGRIVGSVLVARGKGDVKLGGAARVGVGGGCTQHHT